jgi:hypothetical protein
MGWDAMSKKQKAVFGKTKYVPQSNTTSAGRNF